MSKKNTVKSTTPENPIVIETGIPIPPRTRVSKYPFREMKIGASFTLPIEKHSAVNGAAFIFHRKNPEYRFTVRPDKEKGIVRVWRIEAKK